MEDRCRDSVEPGSGYVTSCYDDVLATSGSIAVRDYGQITEANTSSYTTSIIYVYYRQQQL